MSTALPKILFLHGFTQSGSLFAKKASGLRKQLKKAGFETVFLDAPVKLQPSDLLHPISEDSQQEEMLAWWSHNESNPKFYKLDDAIDAVKTCVAKDGPFVGLVGFSQGSGLVGVLASRWKELIDAEHPLKFAVLYSGFKLVPEEYQKFYSAPIDVPSLHIFGSLDSVVAEERSEALADSFVNANILRHPGGHYVPNTKSQVAQVVAFIAHNTKPAAKEEDAEL